MLITDSGNIKDDVSAFLNHKNKDVCIKLANLMRKNAQAPITVKFRVLEACVNSSLTYSCETWGSSPLNNVEVLQRKALKITLNIKYNISNEIAYTESGFKPLKAMIYKRQLKFFRKFTDSCRNNPTAATSKVFNQACDKNITFLKHYVKLDTNFDNPEQCFQHYVNESDKIVKDKIKATYSTDENSILGTYYKVNPQLESPVFYKKPLCMESERIIITQYRTGSHNLRIQTGRLNSESRNLRLCKCETDIQTVDHMLFSCPNTTNARRTHDYEHQDLTSFFNSDNYTKMSDILKTIDAMK